jgi:hypothetical protein
MPQGGGGVAWRSARTSARGSGMGRGDQVATPSGARYRRSVALCSTRKRSPSAVSCFEAIMFRPSA